VLFGDGAGAVVLRGSDEPGGVLSTLIRADGSGAMRYVAGRREPSAGDAGHGRSGAALCAHERARGVPVPPHA